MKLAPESSGIFSKAAQSSTGPREAVKFSLVAAGLCGIANRQLEPLVDGFLFCFCFTLSSHEVPWPAVQLQVDQRVRSNIYSSTGL